MRAERNHCSLHENMKRFASPVASRCWSSSDLNRRPTPLPGSLPPLARVLCPCTRLRYAAIPCALCCRPHSTPRRRCLKRDSCGGWCRYALARGCASAVRARGLLLLTFCAAAAVACEQGRPAFPMMKTPLPDGFHYESVDQGTYDLKQTAGSSVLPNMKMENLLMRCTVAKMWQISTRTIK